MSGWLSRIPARPLRPNSSILPAIGGLRSKVRGRDPSAASCAFAAAKNAQCKRALDCAALPNELGIRIETKFPRIVSRLVGIEPSISPQRAFIRYSGSPAKLAWGLKIYFVSLKQIEENWPLVRRLCTGSIPERRAARSNPGNLVILLSLPEIGSPISPSLERVRFVMKDGQVDRNDLASH